MFICDEQYTHSLCCFLSRVIVIMTYSCHHIIKHDIVELRHHKDFHQFFKLMIKLWWNDKIVNDVTSIIFYESAETLLIKFNMKNIVSSSQLVTRNVVTVNYVDAWVKWWMIFIKSYLEILYRCFLKSFHMLNISLTCYMIDSSHNHKMSSDRDVDEMIIDSWMNH
jgi:hypothetical protein